MYKLHVITHVDLKSKIGEKGKLALKKILDGGEKDMGKIVVGQKKKSTRKILGMTHEALLYFWNIVFVISFTLVE